jgi:hypothetical protein
MPWYLWLIVAWQAFLLLVTVAVAGRTIQVSNVRLSAFVTTTVIRALITWALLANGASAPWTATLTCLAFFDLVHDANRLQRRRAWTVDGFDILVALVIYGGTIALALSTWH